MYLDDLVLSDDERLAMDALAADYGIAPDTRDQLHRDYVQALVSAAQRDSIITDAERTIISAVTVALGVDPSVIPDATASTPVSSLDGQRICFTGQALVDGRVLDRAHLEALAARHGIQPVSSVSKKGCDVLVAADPSSASGKAQKARGFGVPIISIHDFLVMVGEGP